MSPGYSRRAFLLTGVPAAAMAMRVAVANGQGLDQFATAGPPCDADARPTTRVPADATFKPGSPARTSLVEPGLTGTPLMITGTVSGVTCGRIKGARVDFWQADAQGRYDRQGFRLRGHQITDAEGRFRVQTIVPGAAGGRARHVGVHVTVAGKADFWTELFFPDDPGHASDKRFQPALVMKTTKAGPGLAATFDILLDI
jgi:protocatechuate 3,4-dioxygenase beta subunit